MDTRLLAKYGIKCPKTELARSSEEAKLLASRIGYPVALKADSPEVLHKTDLGGVLLNLRDASEVESAYSLIVRRFSGKKLRGVLVQQMAGKGAVELILGGKRDSQFGQMIMLGMGGIYVEVFRDFSLRVCPITESDAEEMLRELRAYPILAGARGKKPVDMKALVGAMLAVSRLLEKEGPKEFDINPLMADESGCVAVDMRLLK
jgi:acyl-CoA synthetase (NDP forming)